MATMIGSLLISLGLDSGKFKTGMTETQKAMVKAQRKFERMGASMVDFGAKLSVSVTAPLALLAKKSVDGFVAQEKAMADVEAALKSMGGASGKTAGELLKASDALELKSLVDGDQILKDVTANLLTFGNISGKIFDRAQQSALDMAERLQVGPKDAAIQLGKALNDPVKGITALGRAGIQFSDDQKAMIKALVETGQTAKAQEIILAEVERQFKGAAAAAADATPWRKAQVAIGQAMDVIGEAILPLIKPVADAIAGLARGFGSLPEPAQKAIVVVGALAAALGPVAMVLGAVIANMAPFLGTLKVIAAGQGMWVALTSGVVGLKVAFGSLLTGLVPLLPVIAAIAAAAALIYLNWDKIAPVLSEVRDRFMEAVGPRITAMVDALKEVLTTLWEGPLGTLLRAAIDLLGEFMAIVIKVFGEVLVRSLSAAIEAARGFFEYLGNWIDLVTALLSGDWSGAWNAAGALVQGVVETVLGVLAALVPEAEGYLRGLYQAAKTWLQDKLGAVFDWVNRKVESVEKGFAWLYDKVVGNSWVPDMVDEIGQNMARLQSLMVDPATRATQSTGEAFRELAGEVSSLMDRLFPRLAQLKALREDIATIDRGEAAGLLTPEVAQEARFRARGGGREATVSAAVLDAPSLVAGMEDVADASEVLADRTRTQTVRIAESFKDMAEKTLDAFRGLADAISGGGFLDILEAGVRAFLQIGGTGLLGKGLAAKINSVPAYAGGTNFHPGGLALVGERGPELVSMPRGSRVFTNAESKALSGGGRQTVEIVDTTGLFRFAVDGQIMEAAPGIAKAGAQGALRMASRRQSRRVG